MPRIAYRLTVAFLLILVACKFDPQAGFIRLIPFGDKFQERQLADVRKLSVPVVNNSSGYDGQFYAQLALDPLLLDPQLATALDAPAYRARRILTPSISSILGGGQPWLTLQIYALINFACWLVFAWLLHGSLKDDGWIGFARWLGCVFSLGVLDSVRQSLVDLPALLLLFLAARNAQTARDKSASLGLTLGNLCKETNLLAAVALTLSRPFSFRRCLLYVGIPLLPLLGWGLYVETRFAAPAVSGAGFGNFTWPFWGMLEECLVAGRALASGNLDTRYTFALLAVVGFLIQGGTIWRHRQPDSAWWRLGAAYSILLLFLGTWVWSGYWAVCRAVLPLTIAFNLLLPNRRSFWPLWIGGNLTLLHAVWRFL